MNLNTLTATEISSGVKSKKFSAQEVVRQALAAVNDDSSNLNSYITVREEEALESAQAVDKKIGEGKPLGPLAGVPIAIKDNMMIKGVRTTCASKILGDYHAPY